jgi:hypothetical protein
VVGWWRDCEAWGGGGIRDGGGLVRHTCRVVGLVRYRVVVGWWRDCEAWGWRGAYEA